MINYLSPFISILAVILSIIATIHVFKITNEEMKDANTFHKNQRYLMEVGLILKIQHSQSVGIINITVKKGYLEYIHDFYHKNAPAHNYWYYNFIEEED